jgi:hypothetical protein
MLPGKYFIAMFYRPVGQDWQLINNNGNYVNGIFVKVVNSNTIELDSAFQISPSVFVKNSYATVKLDVKNSSSSTYFGTYDLYLRNLDGSIAQRVGPSYSADSVTGLPANIHYNKMFSYTSLISVNPGDYYLALYQTPKNGVTSLAGSTFNPNPIKVTVINSPIQPDKFENNDSLLIASNFTNPFVNDSLHISTDSSNIHNGKDVDYYKLILKGGYTYSVDLSVFDAAYNTDGKKYNLSSSILYYSTNSGVSWSTGYTNKLQNKININGADTMYIFVAPKYIGLSGTYLLNIDIKRTCIAPSQPSITVVNSVNNICEGTALILNSSSSTGNQWYLNGTLIPNAIYASDTVKVAGNYSVNVNNGICSSLPSKSYLVVINPIPAIPIITRDTANYLVSSSLKNVWYKDGVALSDSSQRVKYNPPGQFTAKSVQNGCISALSSPYYMVTDVINISKDEFIKLAPNPFINQLNFDFVLKGYQRLNIEVFDIATGIKKASMQNLTPGMPIYLGQLSAGTYVIKVSSNDGKINYQLKMIKL